MSPLLYGWLGVGLFACIGRFLVLMGKGELGIDDDLFIVLVWIVAIAYLICGIFLVKGQDQDDKDDYKWRLKYDRMNRLKQTAISFWDKMFTQDTKNRLSVAIFSGLLAIAVVVGYNMKATRTQTQCLAMIKGFEAESGAGGAHALVIMALRGGRGYEIIDNAEYVYGVSFASCRAKLK